MVCKVNINLEIDVYHSIKEKSYNLFREQAI